LKKNDKTQKKFGNQLEIEMVQFSI
jgi:hypothetical protein